ncbi:hypothetical protein ATANTOWER_029809, partial [Ataeniobius toweri]|nr:hypothetical protein [Ataeniobius toweri]
MLPEYRIFGGSRNAHSIFFCHWSSRHQSEDLHLHLHHMDCFLMPPFCGPTFRPVKDHGYPSI